MDKINLVNKYINHYTDKFTESMFSKTYDFIVNKNLDKFINTLISVKEVEDRYEKDNIWINYFSDVIKII